MKMDSPVAREPTKSRHLRNISERLQQSIQVLDSSLVSSGSLLRASKTPRAGRPYTPRYVQQAPFDVSSYLSSPFTFNTSIDLDVTYSILSEDKKKKLQDVSLDVTVLTATFLEKPDPGVSASASLYEEFLEALQEHSGENRLFDLVNAYIQMCREKLEMLKTLISKLPPSQNKYRQGVVLKRGLQNEVNTWELVRMLYQDRLEAENVSDSTLALMDMLDKRISEKQFVDMLYKHDAMLRQSQLVVNWLELITTKEMEDDAYDRFEFFSDKGFCWENTLCILEQRQSGKSHYLEERPVVTELDPDAPTRQNKPLADLDKENELSFLKSLFLVIRSGQLNQAEQLCKHYGQMWRAATLQGWRLFHDPNYESLGPDGKAQNMEGNPFRDMWKSACWTASEQDCCLPFERAINGALCGNLKAILPVCTTWEEYLWAYFRVMIDTKVELELRTNLAFSRSLEEMPMSYWNQSLTQETIFHELKASRNEVIQEASQEPFHVIQKYIVLDDMEGYSCYEDDRAVVSAVHRGMVNLCTVRVLTQLPSHLCSSCDPLLCMKRTGLRGLVEEMYEQVQQKRYSDHHFVRFAAHLVLFLRTIGRSTKEELCVAILEEYVKVLIGQRQIRLVPPYTATLPQVKQISWYAHFLEDISDRDERQLCLQLAEEAGLDVPVITKTVVENIRSRPLLPLVDQEDLQSVITVEDQQKIDAVDWLVFDPSQRAEAMRQANSLMRQFLGSHKLDAARAVFTKIPPDSIDIVTKQYRNVTFDLSAADENVTREYLCLQAYLQAQDAFSDWFEHFHHGKPECPQLPHSATFTERVAYEHKEMQFRADMERWRHTLDLQTKVTVGKMYNVLLFVDGGWMVDQRTEEVPNEDRAIQMERLRELCLPQITLLLHSVLHSTGHYREAFQLCDVIMSENHKLYMVFRKQELQRLAGKFRESSLQLLDQNLDPLGFPLK